MKKIICVWHAGLGNVVEATPMAVALEEMGYDPKILLQANWEGIDKILPWEVYPPNKLNFENCDGIALSWWARRLNFPNKLPSGESITTYRPQLNTFEFSESQCNFEIAQQLGYKGKMPKSKLKVPDIANPVDLKDYVIISPGFQRSKKYTDWKHKAYPYWDKVIELVKDKHPIIVIGTKEDDNEEMFKNATLNLCGKTDIATMAKAIYESSAVIAVDNGPAHVSDTYEKPTIVLFGPTNVLKNAYFNSTYIFMPSDNVRCRPCQHNLQQMMECKDNSCMKLIKPEQIVEVLNKKLEN